MSRRPKRQSGRSSSTGRQRRRDWAEENPAWAEWLALTPSQRFAEYEKTWADFIALGGSLDPEPDSQSPFYFPESRDEAR